MIPRPMPPYFLIRINIEIQKRRREKLSEHILAHPNEVSMTLNMEQGEIVSIGSLARKTFPEANVGDTLLVHHFVEGKAGEERENERLIYRDDTYKYYLVTCYPSRGYANETYGVFDGEKIIPHPDYIFLEVPDEKKVSVDNFVESNMKKDRSGLFVFEKWEDSREDLERRQNMLMAEVKELSKNTATEEITRESQYKEQQMTKLSEQINKSVYGLFVVAFAHPDFSSSPKVKNGDRLYMLKNACQTMTVVRGNKYIVAKTTFVGLLQN